MGACDSCKRNNNKIPNINVQITETNVTPNPGPNQYPMEHENNQNYPRPQNTNDPYRNQINQNNQWGQPNQMSNNISYPEFDQKINNNYNRQINDNPNKDQLNSLNNENKRNTEINQKEESLNYNNSKVDNVGIGKNMRKSENPTGKLNVEETSLNFYLQSIKYIFDKENLDKKISVKNTLKFSNRNVPYEWKLKSNKSLIINNMTQINTSEEYEPLELKLTKNEAYSNMIIDISIILLDKPEKTLFKGKGSFEIVEFIQLEDSDIVSTTVNIKSDSNSGDFLELNFYGTKKFLKFNEIVNQAQKRFYDLILKVDSFEKIHEGWEIQYINESFKEAHNLEWTVVNMEGNFNNGKTYVLDRIINGGLPEGDDIHTEGASLKHVKFTIGGQITYIPKKVSKNLLFIDLAGQNVPLKIKDKNDLNMKLLGSDFLRKLAFSYSDAMIFVVGRMTNNEKKMIESIPLQFKNIKMLIIVHNFKNETDEKTIEMLSEQQIINVFKVQEIDLTFKASNTDGSNTDNIRIKYYSGKIDQCEMFHFAIANENSHTGKKLNYSAFSRIRNLLITRNSIKKQHFIEFSREYLGKYLKNYALKNYINNENLIDKNDESRLKLNEMLNPNDLKILNEDEKGIIQLDSTLEYICYIDNEEKYVVVDVFITGEPKDYYDMDSLSIAGTIQLKIEKKKSIPSKIEDWKNDGFDLTNYFSDETYLIYIPLRKEDLYDGKGSINNKPTFERISQNQEKLLRYKFEMKKGDLAIKNLESNKTNKAKRKSNNENLNEIRINKKKLDFEIFLSKIEDLFIEDGIKFHLNSGVDMKKVESTSIIGILGDGNVRKLDIINELIGSNEFQHEINYENGSRISFYRLRDKTFVYFDPASEFVIHNSSESDSTKVNKIFLNLITELCDFIIYVTHHITRSQMIYLNNVENMIKGKQKKLFIIHYFYSFLNQASVGCKIKECITEPFEVEEKYMITSCELNYPHFSRCYKSKVYDDTEHIIMCGNTNLKKYYNVKANDYINNCIINSTNRSEFNYYYVFELMKIQFEKKNFLLKEINESKIKENKFKLELIDESNAISLINEKFTEFTPKLMKCEKKINNNPNYDEIILRIAIPNSTSSEMKLFKDLINDNKNYIFELSGSKMKNNKYGGKIISDQLKHGNILLRENLINNSHLINFEGGEFKEYQEDNFYFYNILFQEQKIN